MSRSSSPSSRRTSVRRLARKSLLVPVLLAAGAVTGLSAQAAKPTDSTTTAAPTTSKAPAVGTATGRKSH